MLTEFVSVVLLHVQTRTAESRVMLKLQFALRYPRSPISIASS